MVELAEPHPRRFGYKTARLDRTILYVHGVLEFRFCLSVSSSLSHGLVASQPLSPQGGRVRIVSSRRTQGEIIVAIEAAFYL